MNRQALADLQKRLNKRIRDVSLKMKQIPGEPCGGFAYHCTNPRHGEWHELMRELERLKLLAWRVKVLGAGFDPTRDNDFCL